MKFKQKLQEGIIVRRQGQFVIFVNMDGLVKKCHCPTTGRVGTIDLAGRPCLLSKSDNATRKTAYTVEAISFNQVQDKSKTWIGINQNAVNRYVEYYLTHGGFSKMLAGNQIVRREQMIGTSKLDFLVGDTYLEVKMPLQDIQLPIPSYIPRKNFAPFTATDRLVKHMNELGSSLQTHQRAILLLVFMYPNPGFRVRTRSTHFDQIQKAVDDNMHKGVEIWQTNFKLSPEGIQLRQYFQLKIIKTV